MPSIMKGEVPMKLKSFDEFLSSLTEEDLDYITGNNDDEENNYVVKTTLGDPEAFNKLGALIAGSSFRMCRRLLEKYHQWIADQLEK